MDETSACTCNCSALPSAWVMRFLSILPRGARILDVAAGEGRHTSLFLLEGFNVTAVDVDVSNLEPLVGTLGLTLECRDLEAEPWPYGKEAFDGIVVTNYLHREHFPHYWESLAPGGIFLMETFLRSNEYIWGRPKNPAHGFENGELLRLMPEGARIIAYEEGMASDNRLVARIAFAKPGRVEPYGYPLRAR